MLFKACHSIALFISYSMVSLALIQCVEWINEIGGSLTLHTPFLHTPFHINVTFFHCCLFSIEINSVQRWACEETWITEVILVITLQRISFFDWRENINPSEHFKCQIVLQLQIFPCVWPKAIVLPLKTKTKPRAQPLWNTTTTDHLALWIYIPAYCVLFNKTCFSFLFKATKDTYVIICSIFLQGLEWKIWL